LRRRLGELSLAFSLAADPISDFNELSREISLALSRPSLSRRDGERLIDPRATDKVQRDEAQNDGIFCRSTKISLLARRFAAGFRRGRSRASRPSIFRMTFWTEESSPWPLCMSPTFLCSVCYLTLVSRARRSDCVSRAARIAKRA
jgi:hypothetical protein